MNDCLTIVLAGGRGARLSPLTDDRAKPAVPFGGSYRIIDFTLSNCLNSRLKRILMLTQYKSLSLDRHIDRTWRRFFHSEFGDFISVVPPQHRLNELWYAGTADAVYQNIYSIEKANAKHTVILAGDHIYKMDYRKLLDFHCHKNADLTIGAIPVCRKSARQFGVLQVDDGHQIVDFIEKPKQPVVTPGSDDAVLASMGIYVFNTAFLLESLCHDAIQPNSRHDFGGDIIPSMIGSNRVFAYPFAKAVGERYWRDVGTLDAYYEANMDLLSDQPSLDIFDREWPIWNFQSNLPPAKLIQPGTNQENHQSGFAISCILGSGSVVSGGRVQNSVLGCNTRVSRFAHVENSILFDGVHIGRGARVRNAIIEKNTHVAAGSSIGFDRNEEWSGLTASPHGIVVVAKSSQHYHQEFAGPSSVR